MRKLALLAVRMLRYRVAAMLWMFMLLGAAAHGGLERLTAGFLWAALALAFAYIAATTANDVADSAVDRINHPRDPGRPLVTGEATERELAVLHVIAALAALACGAALGAHGFLFAGGSLVIGWAYSLPPLRLSYRTYLAPLALAVAYVVVPYGFGVLAAGASARRGDALFVAALYALFVARINLKDFRDRAGDAAYGKPTLLLRFGKTATCLVSLVALVLGSVLLLAYLRAPLADVVVVEMLTAAVASRLYALWQARDGRAEQIAIGLGARMGNGLLLTVLGWLALEAHGASPEERTAFAAALATAFALGFVALVVRPQDAVIGYKG